MKKIFIGPGNHLIIPVKSKQGRILPKKVRFGYWYDSETGKEIEKMDYQDYYLARMAKDVREFMAKVY